MLLKTPPVSQREDIQTVVGEGRSSITVLKIMKSPDVSKVEDSSSKNGHLSEDKKSRDCFKEKLPYRKVYDHRNSMVTDMMKINHFQTLHNMWRATTYLLIISTFSYYKLEPSKKREDLDNLVRLFSKFPDFAKFWLLYNLYAFVVYEGFKLWVGARSEILPKVADKMFLLLYIVSSWLSFTVATYFMYKAELLLIWGISATVEQMRIYMKVYSFVRECAPRVLQHKREKDGSQQHVLCPARKQYWYFMFAPVFLYRDNYPRTEKIQWENVFYFTYDFFLCLIFTYCVTFRFFDLFKNVGIQPLTKRENLQIFIISYVLGLFSKLVITYLLFHLWLNIFAELLRFGYREFYQDWWNCRTLGEYYRKWNVGVYDWFYTYIYKELQGIGFSSSFSKSVVLLMTLLGHEYIMSVGTGFALVVSSFIFAGLGMFMGLGRGRPPKTTNLAIWIASIVFISSSYCLYGLEFYARKNCPKQESFVDFFIPRMTDPSCQIFAS